MDLQIRQATRDDYPQIARVDSISFGVSYTEQDLADVFEADPPRFLVAVEDGRVVGVAGDYRFRLTVPGGGLEVPGVTWVSVLPTHRRRGVLRELMRGQLAGYAESGEPAAVLTASEGGIYQRFGYGPASQNVKVSIERRLAVIREPVDTGAVRFLPPELARTRLPELHDRWCELTPGAVSRSESWWDRLFRDRPADRDGLSEKFYLVHPEGYLSYRAGEQWIDGHARNRCVIVDYRCLTPRAHAALWQVLLGMDLFLTIESWELPADDPLPFLLTDPRQVRLTASKDGLWLRPIDVPALLAARRYQLEIEAVLEVAGQRLLLAGGPDGASCVPTDRPSQAVFSLPALASVYLGGHRVRTLARAGQLRLADAGLLGRLDLAFGTDRLPSHGTGF